LRTTSASKEDQEEYINLSTGLGQRITDGSRVRREEIRRRSGNRTRPWPPRCIIGRVELGKPAPDPASMESNTKVINMMAQPFFAVVTCED
jgi:hypothetical protein